MLPDQQQSNRNQALPSATNGTASELDKLFSKLLPPLLCLPTGRMTLKTIFASAYTSALSTPTSNIVAPPSNVTANKGLALLDISLPRPPPPLARYQCQPPPPLPHHVSSEPFP